ncbi:hypothetical protein LCGC14_2336890 [marine sediment metagenome]|uniref:Uncharacterized protein n=1 Tax=marine sediment metagenome TaxID=412755 RepID=A0A0F9D0R2_9ZZZZ
MPKVDYDKYPERVCRWNKKTKYCKEGEYYCEDGEQIETREHCLRCFCNELYEVCVICQKEPLKENMNNVFYSGKKGYVCKDKHFDYIINRYDELVKTNN